MTSGLKILIAIAAVTAISAAVGLVVSYFQLPQTFAPAGIGVVIGMGVALGAFALTPREQNPPQRSHRKIGWKPEAGSWKFKKGSSPWHY